MAEFAVSQNMKRIIDTCFDFLEDYLNDYLKDCLNDYLKDQVGWQTGMKEELERLRANHPKIQAFVFAANQAQISDQNPALDKWIWQLRDAIDEADDVLDEFEYMKHKEQLTKNTEETKKRKVMSSLFGSACKIFKIGERGLKIDPYLKRLEESVQKLDKVSADFTAFLPLLDNAKKEQKEKEVALDETGSWPTNDLIGRRQEKENLVRWLKPSNEEHPTPNNETGLYKNISVLSIVGHGGMGKTVLLQHIYNDEITNGFDLKMWVFVSKNFDVKKVIADMIESVKKERPRLKTLKVLLDLLKDVISSNKFLLVLDNIWMEEENRDISKWVNVFSPLVDGKFGSKILVTTRMASVAMMFAKLIKKNEIFTLKGLNDNDCLELLKSHAFSGVENPNDDNISRKIFNISRDIFIKLSGYPLAVKVIGVFISSNWDENRWMEMLKEESIISLGKNYIYSILRPSYISLSNPLQNCFAFCCLFPQDYLFDKDDLVRMWNSLGFIHNQEHTLKDIGREYFDDLVKNSFFDKVENSPHYKIHVVLHETTSKIYPQEYCKVVDEELSPKIFETIRHLYIQTMKPDILGKLGKAKHLHSLFLSYEASNQDFCNAFIKDSKRLRLLHIYTPGDLKMIPDDIGKLKHLRYLKIDGLNITMLPRSLRNLYHLQYIICEDSPCFDHSEVGFLSSDINNFSNLRYVNLPENYVSSICGIGKLKSLKKLNRFDLRDASGYKIGELENMNDLCILGINYLENVKDAEEACSAKLCEKRRLTDLTLCWSNTDSRNTGLDESVLDKLQPSNYLRNLSIESYMGARSAMWMNDINLIFNLEKIKLKDCLEWETLPPFGKLHNLKSLELCNMPKVKLLSGNGQGCVFQSLEVLRIERLQALEDWFEAGVVVEDGGLFPCLVELVLKDCPKLKERYGEDGGSDRHKIAHIPHIDI